MAKFFINHPVMSMVISIVMVIVGAVAILSLPTAQFPNIADPQIQITATYPGADATTLDQSVATPIEQQMSGVDNMEYMYSLNANNGQMKLTVDLRHKDRSEHRPDSRSDAPVEGGFRLPFRSGHPRCHRSEVYCRPH